MYGKWIKDKNLLNQFKLAVETSDCIAEVFRKLNLRPSGANYSGFKVACLHLNVSTAHFTPHKSSRSFVPSPTRKIPSSEIFIKNSQYPHRREIKRRLIAEGIVPNLCAICSLPPEWNGRPLVLQLDHINGIQNDNRTENLRLVCPNCHSQTPTFSGKNMKRSV